MYNVNSVLKWNDVSYRLIHRDENSVWLFNIESNTPSCVEMKYHDFLRQSDQGVFTEIADPYAELRLRTVTEAEKKRGEDNLKLIGPLIEEGVRPFEPEHLKKLMKDICADLSGNARLAYQRKVKRTLVLWWQRGQVPAVLMPDWAPKKEIRDYKEKPGRKSALSESTPAMNDEIRKAFDKVCKERLLTPAHDSVREAYSVFLYDWMKAKNVTEKQAPTLYQFRYYYNSRYARADRAKAQNPATIFEKDVRPLTGTTYDIAKGPGHIYEIDSTMDNVNLLNSSRTEVVGRPYLYSVTDVFTGLIVGFDLSFEAPQFKTAGDALYNAMEDKVAYCAKHNITIPRSWWPVNGVPSIVTADNAELTSDQALHLNHAYGISVNFTKTRRGDQKGTVESSIGLIQKNVRSLLKHRGLVLKEGKILHKAGDTDSRGDAVLTLDDYRRLVIFAILVQNRRKRSNVPPGLPANIPSRCLDIWKYYESRGRSMLRNATNANFLRLSLLKHYKPTCSVHGICVEGIRYLPEEEEYLKYFRRYAVPQFPDDWQMILDPANVTHAWLQPDEKHNPAKYVRCSLAPSSSHLTGMNLRSATEYIKTAAQTEKEASQKQFAFQGEQRRMQETIVSEAEAKKPADQRTTRQKVKGIRTNRSEEINCRETANPRITTEQTNGSPQSAAPRTTANSSVEPSSKSQPDMTAVPSDMSSSASDADQTGAQGTVSSDGGAECRQLSAQTEHAGQGLHAEKSGLVHDADTEFNVLDSEFDDLDLDMHFSGGNIDMDLV